MQNLGEVMSTYVRETRRLESLPSSTETTFYPDLKLLLSAVLKSERLPFDVITGTSEGARAAGTCRISCLVTLACSSGCTVR
jgi:hypothetical protein